MAESCSSTPGPLKIRKAEVSRLGRLDGCLYVVFELGRIISDGICSFRKVLLRAFKSELISLEYDAETEQRMEELMLQHNCSSLDQLLVEAMTQLCLLVENHNKGWTLTLQKDGEEPVPMSLDLLFTVSVTRDELRVTRKKVIRCGPEAYQIVSKVLAPIGIVNSEDWPIAAYKLLELTSQKISSGWRIVRQKGDRQEEIDFIHNRSITMPQVEGE